MVGLRGGGYMVSQVGRVSIQGGFPSISVLGSLDSGSQYTYLSLYFSSTMGSSPLL